MAVDMGVDMGVDTEVIDTGGIDTDVDTWLTVQLGKGHG